VCIDWWWYLDTCIDLFVHGDIVYPLQIGLCWPQGARESCSFGCCQWPRVDGCHNGLLLWPCGHSRLYVVAAAGVRL
jgi:hypothetical protein